MKRSKLKAIAEQETEEGEAMYGKEITKEMKAAVDKFIVEPSYVPLLNLIVGRVSYGGMNPEVEKHMARPSAETNQVSREMIKDISDLDMARHFTSNLAQNMNKKFSGGKIGKRQLKKKLKLLKQKDNN